MLLVLDLVMFQQQLAHKGGDPHESRILAGYYVFNSNISFTFQAIKNLYADITIYVLGRFVNFLVIFRFIWR